MLSQITALKSQISSQTIQPLLPVLADIILTWPPPKRFPAIDILRLAASKAHTEVSQFKVGENSIVDVLIGGAELKEDIMQGRKELDVNALLVMRTFVNLFDGEQGRTIMKREYEKVLDGAKIAVARSNSKPLKVAFSTLLLKFTLPLRQFLIIVMRFYSWERSIQMMRLRFSILSSKPSKIPQPTRKPSSALLLLSEPL